MSESRIAITEVEALRTARPQHRFLGRRFVLGCVAPFVFLVLIVWAAGPSRREQLAAAVYRRPNNGNVRSPVYNETLGFQKVFAIGLPGRTDKRDAMTVAAGYSGIQIDWMNGVRYNEMDVKAVPKEFDDMPSYITGGAKEAIIGSWRAHLNVMSRIVNERIQTALIMEDDVDWDISIKQQLEEFALGARALQKHTPGDSPRNSTYGDHWDTLWLGHCRIAPSSATQDMYFITNDTTVPPYPFRTATWMQRPRIEEAVENNTRIITNVAAGGCTFAYAVTLQAAEKIIASLSVRGEGIIYDISVGHMCAGLHIAPYNCYGIYPPLFGSHRFAGSAGRDSDIRTKFNRFHEEQTYDIVYSVIMNIARLLSGSRNAWSQWPQDTAPRRSEDESYAAQISRETRTMNMIMALAEIMPSMDVLDAEKLELMGIVNVNDRT